MKDYTKSEILKNLATYTKLISIFDEQKDHVAKERSEANLLKYQNLLKQCK